MLTGALIGALVGGICAGVYVWLQKRNKQLEQFANVLAHDLSAPLNTISGFAALLEKGRLKDADLGRARRLQEEAGGSLLSLLRALMKGGYIAQHRDLYGLGSSSLRLATTISATQSYP